MRAARLGFGESFALAVLHTEAFPQGSNQSETFAKAYSQYSSGNFTQAKDLFQKATDSKFVLADYSLYYLGAIAANEKEFPRARQLFAGLKQRYPQSIWA